MRRRLPAPGLKSLLLTFAAPLLFPAVLLSAEKPVPLVVWPGYVFELPPNHCVATQKGPDFDVLYLRERVLSPSGILAGIYCGMAPNFKPRCAKPATRKWSANGLSFQSVRGEEGCAEFLIHDPANTQRGYLHVWFGPAAKRNSRRAEALIASIRPAPMPLQKVTEPPACK